MKVLTVMVWTMAGLVGCEPITPDEFEQLSTGRTFYFRDTNQRYGAEQYFENRRVRWMFADGHCTDGYWYTQNDAMCFVYEHEPQPQCWLMETKGGEITARRTEFEDMSPITVDRIDDKPLSCAGPDLGV